MNSCTDAYFIRESSPVVRNQHRQYKLNYALKDNKHVHISEVDRGLACGCFCLLCNKPLIARKGNIRSHHFSHSANTECSYTPETILHFLAKKIISESNYITIPEYLYANTTTTDDGVIIEHSGIVANGGRITIDNVLVENEAKRNGFVPDIVIQSGNKSLIIEIYVTHKVDSDKLNRIYSNGEATLEINLNKDAILKSTKDLSALILDEAHNKDWLYHPNQERIDKKLYEKRKEWENRIQNRPKNKTSSQRKNNTAQHRKVLSKKIEQSEKYSYWIAYDKAAYDFFKIYGRQGTDSEIKKHMFKKKYY